jgi:pimeloyl-ACP methyl ester carboxylesterase
MPFFFHDGLQFHYEEAGSGVPFVFQHGLGSDVGQPLGLCGPAPGIRLLSFDCRAHGATRPLGDTSKIRISQFAGDLSAFLDELGIARAIVGGISMGAGVALNFALRYPERAVGLVLTRPAWLDQPLPSNLNIYPKLAFFIREFGAAAGLERFMASDDYQDLARTHPATARSFVSQFQESRAEEAVTRLERIPNDVPNCDRCEWCSIHIPTLVVANRQDPVHPFNYGALLAQSIPDAQFSEVTPKAVSEEQHVRDVRASIDSFLIRRLLSEE